jgi:hypothetical protein
MGAEPTSETSCTAVSNISQTVYNSEHYFLQQSPVNRCSYFSGNIRVWQNSSWLDQGHAWYCKLGELWSPLAVHRG